MATGPAGRPQAMGLGHRHAEAAGLASWSPSGRPGPTRRAARTVHGQAEPRQGVHEGGGHAEVGHGPVDRSRGGLLVDGEAPEAPGGRRAEATAPALALVDHLGPTEEAVGVRCTTAPARADVGGESDHVLGLLNTRRSVKSGRDIDDRDMAGVPCGPWTPRPCSAPPGCAVASARPRWRGGPAPASRSSPPTSGATGTRRPRPSGAWWRRRGSASTSA